MNVLRGTQPTVNTDIHYKLDMNTLCGITAGVVFLIAREASFQRRKMFFLNWRFRVVS